MIFDVIFALFILYGFYKGFSKGLINSFMAIFTYLLGFSIALKCSFPLLQKITQHFNINPKLAPIFSFILAFSLVVLVCQLILFFVEKALKATNLRRTSLDNFNRAYLFCNCLDYRRFPIMDRSNKEK